MAQTTGDGGSGTSGSSSRTPPPPTKRKKKKPVVQPPPRRDPARRRDPADRFDFKERDQPGTQNRNTRDRYDLPTRTPGQTTRTGGRSSAVQDRLDREEAWRLAGQEKRRREIDAQIRRRAQEWAAKANAVPGRVRVVGDIEVDNAAQLAVERRARQLAAQAKATRDSIADLQRTNKHVTPERETADARRPDWQVAFDAKMYKLYNTPLGLAHELAAAKNRLQIANQFLLRPNAGDTRFYDRYAQQKEQATYAVNALKRLLQDRYRLGSTFSTDQYKDPTLRHATETANRPIQNGTDLSTARNTLRDWKRWAELGHMMPRELVEQLVTRINMYARQRGMEMVRFGDKVEKAILAGDSAAVEKLFADNDELLREYHRLMGNPDKDVEGVVDEAGRLYTDYSNIYNSRLGLDALATHQGLGPEKNRGAFVSIHKAKAEWVRSGTKLSFGDWLEDEDRKRREHERTAQTARDLALKVLNESSGRANGFTYTWGMDENGKMAIQTHVDRSNPVSAPWVAVENAARELGISEDDLHNPANIDRVIDKGMEQWDAQHENDPAYQSSGQGTINWQKWDTDRNAFEDRMRAIFGLGHREALDRFLSGLGKSPVGWAWDALQGTWTVASTALQDMARRDGGELYGPSWWSPSADQRAQIDAAGQAEYDLTMQQTGGNRQKAHRRAQQAKEDMARELGVDLQWRLGLDRSPDAAARAEAKHQAYLQALEAAGDNPQLRLQAWNNYGANVFSEDSNFGNILAPLLLDPGNIVPLNALTWIKRGQRAIEITQGSNALVRPGKVAWNWWRASDREVNAWANTTRVLRSVDAKARPEDVLRYLEREAVGLDDASAISKWLAEQTDDRLRNLVGAAPDRDMSQIRRLVEDKIYQIALDRKIKIVDKVAEELEKTKAKAVVDKGKKTKASTDHVKITTRRKAAEDRAKLGGRKAVEDFATKERGRDIPTPTPKVKKPKPTSAAERVAAKPKPPKVEPPPTVGATATGRPVRRKQPSWKDPRTGKKITVDDIKKSLGPDPSPAAVRGAQRRFNLDENWQSADTTRTAPKTMTDIGHASDGRVAALDAAAQRGRETTAVVVAKRKPRSSSVATRPKLPDSAAKVSMAKHATKEAAKETQDAVGATRQRMLKDGDDGWHVGRLSDDQEAELLKDPDYVTAKAAARTDPAAAMAIRELQDRAFVRGRVAAAEAGEKIIPGGPNWDIVAGVRSAKEGADAAVFSQLLDKMTSAATMAKAAKGGSESVLKVIEDIARDTKDWFADRPFSQLAETLKALVGAKSDLIRVLYRSFGEDMLDLGQHFNGLVKGRMEVLLKGWDKANFSAFMRQIDGFFHGSAGRDLEALEGPLGFAVGGQYVFELFQTWRIAGDNAALAAAHAWALTRIGPTVALRTATSDTLSAAMWLVLEARNGLDIAIDRLVVERWFKEAASDLGLNPHLALAQIPFGSVGKSVPLDQRISRGLEGLHDGLRSDLTAAERAQLAKFHPTDSFGVASEADVAVQVEKAVHAPFDLVESVRLAWKTTEWVASNFGTIRWKGAPTTLRARLQDLQGRLAMGHMGDDFPDEAVVLMVEGRKQGLVDYLNAKTSQAGVFDKKLQRLRNQLNVFRKTPLDRPAPRVDWQVRNAWEEFYWRRTDQKVTVPRRVAGAADIKVSADMPFITHNNANAHVLAYFLRLQDLKRGTQEWADITETFIRHMTQGAGVPVAQVREIVQMVHGRRLAAAHTEALKWGKPSKNMPASLRVLYRLGEWPKGADIAKAQVREWTDKAEKQFVETAVDGKKKKTDLDTLDEWGDRAIIDKPHLDTSSASGETLLAHVEDFAERVGGRGRLDDIDQKEAVALTRRIFRNLNAPVEDVVAARDTLGGILHGLPADQHSAILREAASGLSRAEKLAVRDLLSGAKPKPPRRASARGVSNESPKVTVIPAEDVPALAARTADEAVADRVVETLAKAADPVKLAEVEARAFELRTARRAFPKGSPEYLEITARMSTAYRAAAYLRGPSRAAVSVAKSRRLFTEGVVKRLTDAVKDLIPDNKIGWFITEPFHARVERVRELQARVITANIKKGTINRVVKDGVDKLLTNLPDGRMLYDEVDLKVAAKLNAEFGKRDHMLDLKGTPGTKPLKDSPYLAYDSAAKEKVVNQVLRAEGIDPRAYNAVRKVLRQGLVKERKSVWMREEALRRGGDYREAFLTVRKEQAERDALAMLREEANTRFMGASDESILNHMEAAWVPDDIVRGVEPGDWSVLDGYVGKKAVAAMTDGIDVTDDVAMAEFLRQNRPPTMAHSRKDLHEFLREFGYWRTRDIKAFKAGANHWDWQEQLAFFQRNYRFTPDYLNRDLLHDAGYFDDLNSHRDWGRYFGDVNDDATIARKLKNMSNELFIRTLRRDPESLGLRGARTRLEERAYWIGMWGSEITDEAGNLVKMPWLMNAEELRAYWGKGIAPKFDRSNTLIHTETELDSFYKAVDTVIEDMEKKGRSPFNNPAGVRSEDISEWAALIARELAADTDWLTFLQRRGLLSRGLGWQGDFRRTLVMSQLAFFGVNLADSALRHLAFLSDGGSSIFKREAVHTRAARNINSAADIDPMALGGLGQRFGESPFRRLATADRKVTRKWRDRGQAWIGTFRDFAPSLLGGFEEWGRVRVARQIFAQVWDDQFRLLLKDTETRLGRKANDSERLQVEAMADLASKAAARREINKLYPNLSRASYAERVFNDISPFISYMVKNQKVWIMEVLQHPAWATRIRVLQQELAKHNREEWEKNNPGVPMPDELAYQVRLPWMENAYIDPSMFTDATRGTQLLSDKTRPLKDWLYKTFRPLAPVDVAMIHAVTDRFGWTGHWQWVKDLNEDDYWDGKSVHRVWTPDGEPWSGNPVTLGSILWPFDLGGLVSKALADGTVDTTELTRILHKFLFYGDLNEVDPFMLQNEIYQKLRDTDPAAAKQFLLDNPLLADWQLANRLRPRDFYVPGELDPYDPYYLPHTGADTLETLSGHDWLMAQSYEFRTAVGKGYADKNALYDSFTERLERAVLAGDFKLASAIRKERREAMLVFYRNHPELVQYEVLGKDADAWATQMEAWKLDDLVDNYFDLLDGKPVRRPGESNAAFQERRDAWRDEANAYLAAYPQVRDRVRNSVDSVAAAQDFQEDLWRNAFDRMGRYGEALEAAKAAKNYDLAEAIYKAKDIDAALFESEVWAGIRPGDIARNGFRIGGVTLPDLTALRLNNMTEAEKTKFYKDRQYGLDMKDLIARVKEKDGKFDPARFVNLMKKDPDLMAEYFKRNPGTEQEWADNQTYIDQIGKFGRLMKHSRFDDAYDYFDSLPKWIRDRYYDGNPGAERRREYADWWGRFHDLMDAGKRNRAFAMYENMPPWVMKRYLKDNPDKAKNFDDRGFDPVSAEKNGRYIGLMQKWTKFFDRGDPQGAMDFFWNMPAWARERYFDNHPGKRNSWGRSSEYGDWMGRWSKTFDGGFDKSAKFFWSMPQWVRQQYFKAHPNSGMRKTKDGWTDRGGSSMSDAQFKEYGRYMGQWVKLMDKGSWDDSNAYFWSMPAWVRKQYFKNNPNSGMRKTLDAYPDFPDGGHGMSDARFREYGNYMGEWIKRIEEDDWDKSNAYFWSMPAWVRRQYFKNNPNSGMRKTRDGGFNGPFKPGQRPDFDYSADDKAYIDAMGQYVQFFKDGDEAGAEAFFRTLPAWMKRRYLEKHPDKFAISIELEMQAKLAEYFNGNAAHQAEYLAAHPEVAAFLNQHSSASQRFSMLMKVYEGLPDDEWIKRNFREMYPEVFSAEAKAERRIESKWREAESLGLTDEMIEWLKALSASAQVAMKWSVKPPKPVEFIHPKRRRRHTNTYSALDLDRAA